MHPGVFDDAESIENKISGVWGGLGCKNMDFSIFSLQNRCIYRKSIFFSRKRLKFEYPGGGVLWAANRLEALFWTLGWVQGPKT